MVRCSILHDYRTGESRGIGMVTFEEKEDGAAALTAMDGKRIETSQLEVAWLSKCLMRRSFYHQKLLELTKHSLESR